RSEVKAAAQSAPQGLSTPILELTTQQVPNINNVLSRIDDAQSELDERLYHTDAAVRSVCDEVAALNRIGLVHQAVDGEEGLVAQLSLNRQVRLFGFGDSLKPIDSSQIATDAAATHSDL